MVLSARTQGSLNLHSDVTSLTGINEKCDIWIKKSAAQMGERGSTSGQLFTGNVSHGRGVTWQLGVADGTKVGTVFHWHQSLGETLTS